MEKTGEAEKVGEIMNMTNRNFSNLPQRSIYYFLSTFPSFRSVTDANVTAEEQEAAYNFIYGIYTTLYDDPSILGFRLVPDDSFGDWEEQKAKPGLAPKIRGIIYKTEELMALLYNISLNGEVRGDNITVSDENMVLKSTVIKQLAKFGVEAKRTDKGYTFAFPPNAAKGLKLIASISHSKVTPEQKEYVLFSRGVFDADAPWTKEVFGNMLDDRAPFDRLIDFLDENGYERIDGRQEENRMATVSLDYIKNYANAGDKLKWAWAERTHGGMEVIFEEIRTNQPLYSMRVPYFGELLRHSEKMSRQVKTFICEKAKRCDNCRYCVQTDKTGKKPLRYAPVDECNICPLFCGFQFRWRTLDSETVDNIIELLRFIDEIFKQGGAGEQELKRWAKSCT